MLAHQKQKNIHPVAVNNLVGIFSLFWSPLSWTTTPEHPPPGQFLRGVATHTHTQMFSDQVAFTLRDGNGNSKLRMRMRMRTRTRLTPVSTGKAWRGGCWCSVSVGTSLATKPPKPPNHPLPLFQIIILNAAICHLWGFATCPLWLECVVCSARFAPSLSLDTAPLFRTLWVCVGGGRRVLCFRTFLLGKGLGKQIVKSSPGKYF